MNSYTKKRSAFPKQHTGKTLNNYTEYTHIHEGKHCKVFNGILHRFILSVYIFSQSLKNRRVIKICYKQF